MLDNGDVWINEMEKLLQLIIKVHLKSKTNIIIVNEKKSIFHFETI
jgi:hypothetical protein